MRTVTLYFETTKQWKAAEWPLDNLIVEHHVRCHVEGDIPGDEPLHPIEEMTMETAMEPVEGIRDRIVQIFLRSIGIDIDGIMAGDTDAIRAAAKKIALMIGPEIGEIEGELDDVVAEALEKDAYGALYEFGDMLMKFCGPKAKPPKLAPAIRMMGAADDVDVMTTDAVSRKRFDKMTNAEASKWLADHRANVREGLTNRFIKRRLEEAPELLEALNGNKPAVGISPERLEQLYQFAKKARTLATWLAVFPPLAPYMAAVSAALTFFITWYDTHYGELVGAAADLGLSLEDLAS